MARQPQPQPDPTIRATIVAGALFLALMAYLIFTGPEPTTAADLLIAGGVGALAMLLAAADKR